MIRKRYFDTICEKLEKLRAKRKLINQLQVSNKSYDLLNINF